MKILILGVTGFLGSYLKSSLIESNDEILYSSRHDFLYKNNHIELSEDLKQKILYSDICINCIANTNFVQCKDEGVNGEANVLIPMALAKVSGPGTYIVHISSDIFYESDENNSSESSPLTINNDYAYQKRESEIILRDKGALILRTSFMGINHRGIGLLNHIKDSILNNNSMDGWSDVYSSSVSINHLIALLNLIIRKKYRINGIYNYGTDGYYSKFKYAQKILKLFNQSQLINEINFKPANIERNRNSGMSSHKIKDELGIALPSFKEVVFDGYNDIKRTLMKI